MQGFSLDISGVKQIENAIIEYLRPGEKISLSSYNRPGDSFEPFTKLGLKLAR